MNCLHEHEATDLHKIGNHYILITKKRELIHLDQNQRVIDKKKWYRRIFSSSNSSTTFQLR